MKKLISSLSVISIACSSASSVFSCGTSAKTSDVSITVNKDESNTNYSTVSNTVYDIAYNILNVVTYSKDKYVSNENDNDFNEKIGKSVLEKYSFEGLNNTIKTDSWKEFYDAYSGENFSDQIDNVNFKLDDTMYTNYGSQEKVSEFYVVPTTKTNDKYEINGDAITLKEAKDNNLDGASDISDTFTSNSRLIGSPDNIAFDKTNFKLSYDDSPKNNIVTDFQNDQTIYLTNDKIRDDISYYISCGSFELDITYSHDDLKYTIPLTIGGMNVKIQPTLSSKGDGIYLLPLSYTFNKENNSDKNIMSDLTIDVGNIEKD